LTIDERIEALTVSMELAHREIQDLRALATGTETIRSLAGIAQTQNSSIRGLVHIAETHERRLPSLEGGE
jgi:hypothetical protein